eukprot:UN09884
MFMIFSQNLPDFFDLFFRISFTRKNILESPLSDDGIAFFQSGGLELVQKVEFLVVWDTSNDGFGGLVCRDVHDFDLHADDGKESFQNSRRPPRHFT